MKTNLNLTIPPQRLKVVSFIILILLTFCLSLQNAFPINPNGLTQMLKQSWCYGDSHDIQDQVITTRYNKMVALEQRNA